MKILKKDFNQNDYLLWESGLLNSVLSGSQIYHVKFIIAGENSGYFDSLCLKAACLKQARERACFVLSKKGRHRPEDINLLAVCDESENLIWIDESPENPLKKKDFEKLERRKFITGFGWTTVALMYPLLAHAGGFIPFAFFKKKVIVVTVAGAPTIGTATAVTYSSASVTFTPPASNGGAAITSYTVTSSPGSLTGSGASSPITVSGLTGSTAYTFTVTAINSIGTSSASSASNSITTPAQITVAGAPTIGTATVLTYSSARVSFTAPASNGGAAITSYTATSSPGNITGTAAASPITITGLTASTAYTFTVKATNSVGLSAASSASNSITTPAPCLVAGSLITMADGTEVPIELIKVGDKLKTYDVDNRCIAVGEVSWVQETKFVDGYFEITADDGTLIKITGEHPMFIMSKNNKGKFLVVNKVKVGQSFLNKNNDLVKIIKKEYITKNVAVHNVTIDKYHNYFGAGVLCHNTGL